MSFEVGKCGFVGLFQALGRQVARKQANNCYKSKETLEHGIIFQSVNKS
jgi:hypothetical protein